jgi:hypothetical protein
VKYNANSLVWFETKALVKQKRFEPPIPEKSAPLHADQVEAWGRTNFHHLSASPVQRKPTKRAFLLLAK